MNIKLTPQLSFISIALLAVFSFTGYYSVNFIGEMFDQEPVVQQDTHVNDNSTTGTLKSEIPLVTPYPNPFYSSQFYIDVTLDNPDFQDDNYRAVIYDVLGKQVGGNILKIGRNTIPADNWKPGVYFVHVLEGERVIQTLRVVKNSL